LASPKFLSLFPKPLKSPDGGEGDKMVVTTLMRASAGTRFKAMLQPTQPARRAVGESGFPPSLYFGATSRLMTNYLAAP
jgi:hypothetical protein